MSTARLHWLTWLLIYGGLFAICLGFALQRGGAEYGWGVFGVGTAAALVGAVLVWIRSRMPDPADG